MTVIAYLLAATLIFPLSWAIGFAVGAIFAFILRVLFPTTQRGALLVLFVAGLGEGASVLSLTALLFRSLALPFTIWPVLIVVLEYTYFYTHHEGARPHLASHEVPSVVGAVLGLLFGLISH